jgi:hypothetical protein
MDEAVTAVDFGPFIESHPAMWGQMAAYGWTTADALRAPVIEYRIPDGPHAGKEYRAASCGWEALWELRNVGPRRILDLVNFLRDRGVELPWFADWDERSANWTALEGCRRAEPHRG